MYRYLLIYCQKTETGPRWSIASVFLWQYTTHVSSVTYSFCWRHAGLTVETGKATEIDFLPEDVHAAVRRKIRWASSQTLARVVRQMYAVWDVFDLRSQLSWTPWWRRRKSPAGSNVSRRNLLGTRKMSAHHLMTVPSNLDQIRLYSSNLRESKERLRLGAGSDNSPIHTSNKHEFCFSVFRFLPGGEMGASDSF